jgi:hypothetical protein
MLMAMDIVCTESFELFLKEFTFLKDKCELKEVGSDDSLSPSVNLVSFL